MTTIDIDAVRDLRGALFALRRGERLVLAELARQRLDWPAHAGRLWGLVHLAASERYTPKDIYLALAAAPMSDRERIAHLAFIARQEFAKIPAPGYAAVLSALAEAALAATAAEDEALRAALPEEPQAVLVPDDVDFLDIGDDGPIAA